MFFHEDHPGFKFAYVLKRVKEMVPMISIDTDFPDLESLQMDCNNASSSVWFLRERERDILFTSIDVDISI